ncbi:MAG: RHS repeat-associated core domain-containing protein, partial [Mycobacteriaceae bacterium]
MALTATNTVTAARRFDPFGNPRGTGTGAWPDARGFLNQPADTSTGLTHLGARDYDPVIGRFISVDPELDLSDPTQWNAYGYANSNPTTLSDPSGRRPQGAGDSGCGNCTLTASGTWTFGNETAGSKSVRGGTYHQSYANVQDQQSAKEQEVRRRHVTDSGDNTLAHEAAQRRRSNQALGKHRVVEPPRFCEANHAMLGCGVHTVLHRTSTVLATVALADDVGAGVCAVAAPETGGLSLLCSAVAGPAAAIPGIASSVLDLIDMGTRGESASTGQILIDASAPLTLGASRGVGNLWRGYTTEREAAAAERATSASLGSGFDGSAFVQGFLDWNG